MIYQPLACSAAALGHQRDWARTLRSQLSDGAPYVFVNADTPHEIFHHFDIPVVVNQWWSSVIAAKKLATHHLDRAVEIGFHDGLAKYSALPLIAAMEGNPETQPWGGLPEPALLCSRASADDHSRIFTHWARLTGARHVIFHAPHPDRNRPDWWTAVREGWEDHHGTARLDLMQRQIGEVIAQLEDLTGRAYDPGEFAAYMDRIDRQERIFEEVSQMIAGAERMPVRIGEQIPNVMLPQWHRGSDWSLAHAARFRDEVAQRIAEGSAVCPQEEVRMMWIGAGLWFDTSFYTAFEDLGAPFVWSMYLPFAADGYIRRDHGDPLRTLAARVISMNEQLHLPIWAEGWLAKQARDYRADLAVILIPEADRPSAHGTRFIAHELRNQGVEVVEIVSDMVDPRKWRGDLAKQAVADGIARVKSRKSR